MPTPESSLSVAIQGLADFLDTRFDEDVVISVDSPQKASETAKTSGAEILNIFAHRITPSGFHPDLGSDDPYFIRVNVLLTAFPRGQGTPEPDADLRVLGHAVRVLQSFPVIPVVLPGPVPAGAPASDFRNGPVTEYRLQVVMQATTMEEMNHTWTTQGGELAYRLSAVYELALIPIEPITHATPAPPVQTGEMVIAPGVEPRPYVMFRTGNTLTATRSITAGTATTELVLTGEPGSQVALRVEWLRSDGKLEPQPPQQVAVASADPDTPAARVTLNLTGATAGDKATVITLPVAPDGTPIAGASAGNLIQLNVGP